MRVIKSSFNSYNFLSNNQIGPGQNALAINTTRGSHEIDNG